MATKYLDYAGLQTYDTKIKQYITNALASYQPLDTKLTSISGLANNKTGLIKLTNGVASFDENTYLTGITSSMVTTALGYTPYNSTNPNGYTSNTGTVIGSNLTADYFALGNGTVNIKASTMKPTTSTTTWSSSSDVNVPTMKAISSYVTGLGYTTNTGTVTSVGAGTGLSISGTASVNPTVNIASGYKLPTTTEWSNVTTAISTIPTKTSDITNDSGFITNSVNNLTNYYKKTETYTQAEVDALISVIPKFAIAVVDSLPTTDISTTTIYLLRTSQTETGNLYTEYIYVNNAWETLGTQTLDLSNYVDKSSNQTISGVKTFNDTPRFNSGTFAIGGSQRDKNYAINVDCAGSDTSGRTLTLPDATGTLAMLENIAPAYSSSATYGVGQFVVYNKKLYKCSTAITTAEAWNSNHWAESNLDITPITTTEINSLFS